MGEAAVTFLLEQVKEVVREYKTLISEAENEFIQLNNELGLLKAFLKDAAKATKQEHLFREMEQQIRGVVYEVEDTIDTCLTKAIEDKAKKSSRLRLRVGSSKTLSLMKDVKAIRQDKVLPMFNDAKMKFSKMQIGDGSKQLDDPRAKLNRDKPIRQNRVVGFEDEEATITGYLMTDADRLDVIPIIGIPGQGKTTLVWKIYLNEDICYHFPIRIWIYISQKFNSRDVFLQIVRKCTPSLDTSNITEDELADTVRLCLKKEKFLLVLDDVWSVDAWKVIKEVLPLDNGKGKVLITSRENDVGVHSTVYRKPHQLRFLTEPESWTLLQYEVFGELDACMPELEDIGKQIANKCDGVPLTIVVIGGILLDHLTRGTGATREWEAVSQNVSVALANDEGQRITSVVALSYGRLPDDLRDCFVYLGVFPEDYEIPAKMLYGLWIAEGFIQPKEGRSMEETAEENLDDLIRRNLVKVDKTNHMGKVKTCRVHDMIRAFCINKSKMENLFHEIKKSKTGVIEFSASEVQNLHRLCFHSDLSNFLSGDPRGPHVRSFLCFYEQPVGLKPQYINAIPDGFPKLRILESKSINFHKFPAKVTKLIHLRYLTLFIDTLTSLPEAISQLWNLQTLVVETKTRSITMDANMWRMIRLRHLKTKAAILLNNAWDGEAGQSLQTLDRLAPESCTEAVSRKAKNLRTLGVSGELAILFRTKFLENMLNLEKLKLVNSLVYEPTSEDQLHSLPHFPPNLKSLTLRNTFLDWKLMPALAKIKTLEVLKLKDNAFVGRLWRVARDDFPSLQLLLIVNLNLLSWEASTDAFHGLRYLVVKNCDNLKEIPECVGTHLQKLEIERVCESAIESAKKIEETKKGERKGKFSVEFDLKLGPVSGANKSAYF